MSSGWIECVGIADRSAYDLKVQTKVELVAREVFPEPRMEEVVVMKANNGLLGRNFKGDNALVLEGLNNVC
jgi:glycyl-tRNA synthetase